MKKKTASFSLFFECVPFSQKWEKRTVPFSHFSIGLFLTGRKKNVIVLKNGKNIYPEEIEVLINNLPYVTEALVFGYPKGDDLILSAKIVYDEHYVKNNFKDLSKEGFEEKVWNDIKEINTTVPKYKHVKKIIVTDEPMIKTTTAKIKRFEEIEKIIKEKQIEL